MINSDRHISLLQLNSLIGEVIADGLPENFWVEAEIARANENRGHLFLELVQNDPASRTPVAKASARCWANMWAVIKNDFVRVTGQQLTAGMNVLLLVSVRFHPAYGMSLDVSSIDATYTLGDMERRRREIIQQLKEQGVMDLQKELHLPLFCQHIAVISSATAAGYGDFCNQLTNGNDMDFHTTLFTAVMQGEQVEASIISQLNAIYVRQEEFDCVVIIRGGGATSDLSGFDTLALAENVANFPLPVITGIGHDRDETVLDVVAHMSLKTPTAVASFFVDRLQQVAYFLDSSMKTMQIHVGRLLDQSRMNVERIAQRLPESFAMYISVHQHRLELLKQKMDFLAPHVNDFRRQQLVLLEQHIKTLDPQRMLNMGYSITTDENGCVIRSDSDVCSGQAIVTRLANGTIKSIVE